MDGVTTIVDVSSAELGTTAQAVAWWRTDLPVDQLHTITVRLVQTDDSSAALYHVAFM